jgi:hypothetical protein
MYQMPREAAAVCREVLARKDDVTRHFIMAFFSTPLMMKSEVREASGEFNLHSSHCGG